MRTDAHAAKLSVGPVLFHWPAEKKLDFYARLAAAPIDTVYLGEVVCSKRIPFFEHCYQDIAALLAKAGKKVIFSTLAEVMIKYDRQSVADICSLHDILIEANDASALYHLSGKPHALGPFLNVYNEDTLEFLAGKGAVHATLPYELNHDAIEAMGKKAEKIGVGLEIQVYGRMPLALSARCYHARAQGRVKDNCQFVCEQDPDGMDLKTMDGRPFLSINGIQTLSHACLNLVHELRELVDMGVTHFRLSPHTGNMVETARLFRAVLDGELCATEAASRLTDLAPAPFANGFYYQKEGYRWIHPT
jgi:collagenase-like PrtC family protease